MLILPPMALLAVLVAPQQAPARMDTTLAVPAEASLEIINPGGSITISTWNKNELRLVAEHDPAARISIDSSATGVSVAVGSDRSGDDEVAADLTLTIPARMAIEISGIETDVRIRDAGGEVTVQTVEGDVEVTGGRDLVSLHSVDGDVTLRKAKGNIELMSVDGSLTVEACEGDIVGNTVDGDVSLTAVRTRNVKLNTVDGDISYEGTIQDSGRYSLSTHDGDVTIVIPEGTNARVSVSTFDGELETSFPVQMKGSMGRNTSFTLGTGKARVNLNAFDGAIRIVRPGEADNQEKK